MRTIIPTMFAINPAIAVVLVMDAAYPIAVAGVAESRVRMTEMLPAASVQTVNSAMVAQVGHLVAGHRAAVMASVPAVERAVLVLAAIATHDLAGKPYIVFRLNTYDDNNISNCDRFSFIGWTDRAGLAQEAAKIAAISSGLKMRMKQWTRGIII